MGTGRREDELAETQEASGDLASDSTLHASEDDRPPPSEARVLDKGTTAANRYVIEGVLGRGGMGTVYLANDTQLGRQVALKLHRRTHEAERLYREAVAMAQLDHPNVVTVFEIGMLDDQRFVAMEYVRGETMRAWAVGKPWRAIAEMLLEAGEGLYAAHKKGLVHRDFKPENVLVDEEGRPRVSDFGLARSIGDVSVNVAPTGPLPAIPGSSPMTLAGAILGTPAYMAPEQFAGEPVDARSDQFAFCIVAWELLYRCRPFAGGTFAELRTAIAAGALELPPESDVPRAVPRVLRRGLALRPVDRWPDLAELLAALRTALHPRQSRVALVAAVAAVVLLGGGAFAWTQLRSHDNCGAAGAEIDAQLPPALRQRMIDAAATTNQGPAAQKNIGAFVETYRANARAACTAAAHHDWSPELAARSASCRREQLHRMKTVIEEELTDKVASSRMGAMTTTLADHADLAPCNDPSVLATTQASTDVVADARGDLLAALDVADLTGFVNAQRLVDETAAGRSANAPELAAPFLIARAVLVHDKELDQAIKLATDGYYRAHGNGDGVSELIALRHLLYWVGNEKEDAQAAEPWYRLAQSEVDRLERQSVTRAAALRLAIVGVAFTRNELPVAVEQAKRAVDEVPVERPLLRATALREYAGALSESGDNKSAVPIYDETVKLLVATIGSDDIQVAQTMGDFALTLAGAGERDRSVEVARQAAEILARHHVTGDDRAIPELNLGIVLRAAHANADARKLLLDARDAIANQPAAPLLASIETELAGLDREDGHPADAEQLARHAIAIDEAGLGKDHPDVADASCELALCLRAEHQLREALAAAQRCSTIRNASLPGSQTRAETLGVVAALENDLNDPAAALRDAEAALALPVPHITTDATATPRIEQARALMALGRDPDRARSLLAEARAFYAAAHEPAQVDEVDALAAKLH